MLRNALLLSLLAAFPLAQAAPDLSTVAERSGYQATGRYEEVQRLCTAYQKAYPKAVRCFTFGETPEGRPMLALAVSRTGALSAAAAKQRKLPVLLVQGGIHAGEIDGKDAGFWALHEALDGKAAAGALDKQVVLFVPVFNVDGHERFSKNNRPNQRGPVEMGWRVTAQNYNLNRDYVKADAPEMQAMLKLVNEWDPLAYIDLHVTDGAKFQPDVSIQVEPVHGGDPELLPIGKELRENVMADLRKQGSDPRHFYISFDKTDQPDSGFVDSMSTPRFSTGYFPLRNRFAMLVETHSWRDYPHRVKVTRNTIVSLMDQFALHGAAWAKAAAEADVRAAKLENMALSYKTTERSTMIDFPGYEYTRTPSDVSGGMWTKYDESKPQKWTVPLRDEVVPDMVAVAPAGGYLIPAAQAALVEPKLKVHGISYAVLKTAPGKVAVETFRADEAKLSGASFEGHQLASWKGAWKPEQRDVGKGALFVPIAQAKSRLVMTMLEPAGADSLAAWGFFNNYTERKEYMEEYVAEEAAREMLAADPALAAAFKARLESDPAFAKNPRARLDFFARRHGSWDERQNLYPVYRSAVVY
ncbi:peptidase M14 [Pseudoduganella eburnea]|uniref:Peptidase M14 n=1 Tax=Massilia eburnea TaxID=1776165 RepID=A0A6L6QDG7_9BURK|nr:M14 family metallopeptidase [Massilia eburnea]MTW09766.1 peptidase M14 [Massilia eburnea]